MTEEQSIVEMALATPGTAPTAVVADSIRLENIHAGYGKKEVLRSISLSAGQGELVSLIGPNGSGKSTLLKVIAGFLIPTQGQVWFGDQEITALAPHRRVKLGLAYFMQGGRVFPNLTARENLAIATAVLPQEERDENIATVLSLFPKLESLSGRRAGLLSGGERQALALALLFVRRPRLLLLDEPSAGLSPKLVRDMLSRINELSRAWKTSVLLVEQNVREALNISDRALALVNGRISLETSQPKDWLTSGELVSLFMGHGPGRA